MPLDSGARIGQYEVKSLIGAGGMGEVYRARDTRLKRDVALKVLPAALSRDPERLGRFQREAEILASLNHPGIAGIHGMAESGEVRAIVMEFVEGQTLPVPLPMDTVLNYARQMVEALEYAHDRGVVHRDLKPANVRITPEGQVKLLDFGLAKAIEDPLPSADPANSPTLTLGHTRAGAIMGTAAYMSPEQAVGKPVDRRSDIFSFGAVLYEMLTGQRTFTGATAPEILVAVAKDEPDWSKLPQETPQWLRGLLGRCLAKDRKQRLQAIGEARIAMERGGEGGAESPAQAGGLPHRWGWVAAGAMTAVAAVALWGWLKPAPPEPRPVTRFSIPLAQGQGKNPVTGMLSRDGSRLAIPGSAGAPISLRMMDQFESKPIPGTEGAGFSCFSPDGQWIAFTANGTLKKVPVSGGAALTLAESAPGADMCHWGEDDTIVFGANAGLMRVPAAGGKPENIAAPDGKKGEASYEEPQLLPGGKTVLFTILGSQGINALQIAAVDLQTRNKQILLEGAGAAWYAPSGPDPSKGHIVYGRSGSLFAVPFDVNRLQAGSPAPVLDGVTGFGGVALFGISDSGTLAYVSGGTVDLGTTTLVSLDRKGAEQPLAAPPRDYNRAILRVSPDGGRIALAVQDLNSLTQDVWVHDLARGSLNRITFDGANNNPVWTPDGKRLVFTFINSPGAQRGELRSVPADGSGSPTTLLAWEGLPYTPATVSPDGKVLLAARPRGDGPSGQVGQDIWSLALDPDTKPQLFLESPFNKRQMRFSPDGKWLAYTSNESRRPEIYVVPYPGPGGKTQVSTDGGTAAKWSRNGRELFYRNGKKVMAVEVETGAVFRAGTPKVLFERDGPDLFDVAPDGRFFMLKEQSQQAQASELRVVVNWFEELRRRVPLDK
jgi:serine/threonine-protein kinase